MNLDKFLAEFHLEGEKLHAEGRDHEILYSCEQVAVQALNSLGLAYCTYVIDYEKSLKCFRDALVLDPGNWLLWSNITHVYSLQGKHQEALDAAYNTIHTSRYEVFEPFYNAGVVLNHLGKMEEAIQNYRNALAINPNNDHAQFNLGLALLRNGQLQEGWELYDYRFKTGELTGKFKQRFIEDEWDGRKFKKKTLLVYSEQGLGDFVMFCRFLPKVQALGGKVIVEAQEPIAELVRQNFKDIEVVSRENTNNWPKPPKADYVISVNSLPRVLKIHDFKQIPSEPYMKAKTKKKIKGPAKKFKIGLCWLGNSDHKRDSTRSFPVTTFEPLTQHPKVQCYSLAKGTYPHRKWPKGNVNLNEGIERLNMIDLGSEFNDYAELASVIEGLDLVVTVDTGLAHLCGAMGKPCWVLLGNETDWRWMDNSTTSPWYPSLKLIRYKGSWANSIQEVIDALPVK